jgi:endonuclease III
MAITNGTKTASALLALQMEMTKALNTDTSVNRLYKNFDPATAKAALANQAAKIEFSKEKEQSMKIVWFEQVETAVEETATTECDFTGAQGGTDAQTNVLDAAINTTFSVNSKDQRTNEISEQQEIAQLMLQHMYQHAKNINAKVLAFLEANIGTSAWAPSGYTNNASGIVVPAVDYNDNLMSKIARIEILNNLMGSFAVTGGDFYDAYFNAEKKFANADGKDNRNRLDAINWVFDIRGLGAVANQPIYMVSPFAYAFANKARDIFPMGAPRESRAGDKVYYSLQNPFLPGVYHEVTERYDCLENAYDTTHFAIDTQFKGFMNPKSANASTNTGIIKLFKGA